MDRCAQTDAASLSALGGASSHGCVRLDNATVRWLNVRIGPGIPVTIQS